MFPAAEATSSNVKEERLIGNKAPNIVQHKELAFESTLLAAVEENIDQNLRIHFHGLYPWDSALPHSLTRSLVLEHFIFQVFDSFFKSYQDAACRQPL